LAGGLDEVCTLGRGTGGWGRGLVWGLDEVCALGRGTGGGGRGLVWGEVRCAPGCATVVCTGLPGSVSEVAMAEKLVAAWKKTL